MKPETYRGRDRSSRPAVLSVAGFPLLLCLLLARAHAGSFRNLDFESSPSFPAGDYNYPFTVYANALPGWTVRIEDAIQNGACANEFLLDAPVVALMTSSGDLHLMQGQKSVYLQSAASAPISFPGAHNRNVSIAQTGLGPPGPFVVQLGTRNIPLVPISSSSGDAESAGDVSPWAGQTVELSIRVLASTNWGNTSFPEGWALVDSITFQPGVLLSIAVTTM
jgi:hypothetical protein